MSEATVGGLRNSRDLRGPVHWYGWGPAARASPGSGYKPQQQLLRGALERQRDAAPTGRNHHTSHVCERWSGGMVTNQRYGHRLLAGWAEAAGTKTVQQGCKFADKPAQATILHGCRNPAPRWLLVGGLGVRSQTRFDHDPAGRGWQTRDKVTSLRDMRSVFSSFSWACSSRCNCPLVSRQRWSRAQPD
ncbi:hypothetical protein BDZ91DRAFT_546542 [Kalaharituber pfeilii]|nr:hypothetical protein BDZ91DRAFT_546542 [Kalaharituber pfeilii]